MALTSPLVTVVPLWTYSDPDTGLSQKNLSPILLRLRLSVSSNLPLLCHYLNFLFLSFFLSNPFPSFRSCFTFVIYSIFFPLFPLLFLFSTTLHLPVSSVFLLLSTLFHIFEELHYKWKVSFFYL